MMTFKRRGKASLMNVGVPDVGPFAEERIGLIEEQDPRIVVRPDDDQSQVLLGFADVLVNGG